jgi:hypothetical protein
MNGMASAEAFKGQVGDGVTRVLRKEIIGNHGFLLLLFHPLRV